MHRYFAQVDELLRSPDMSTVFHLSFRKPANIMAEYLENGRPVRLTYGDARLLADRAAGAISRRLAEVKRDSYVGIKLKNSPWWGIVFWAVLMCGYRPLLIDASGDAEYTAYVLQTAGAAAIICDQPFASALPVVQLSDIKRSETASFEERFANAVAFCSSGTTGEVTVHVFTGDAVCAQIESARIMPEYTSEIMYPDETRPLKNLALLPFHHVFGFVAVFLWYTFFQKTIVYVSELSPAQVLSTCKKLRVTHFYCVPLFWNGVAETLKRQAANGRGGVKKQLSRILAAAPHIGEPDFSYKDYDIGVSVMHEVRRRLFGQEIRFAISGGGYISPDTLRLINALRYPLCNGYGLTEAGITSVELSPKAADRVMGAIGVPLYGVRYGIIPQNGDPDYGELTVASAQLSCGHIENGVFVPAQYPDGTLHTGDLVRRVNGRYYICGRLKDLIITESGENISPDELEACFCSLPGVDSLCVMGVHRPSRGDEITLVIKFSDTAGPREMAEVRERVYAINQTLPPYKMVRRVLMARDPLPVTSTRKIRRGLIREGLERGDFPAVGIPITPDCVLFPDVTPAPGLTAGVLEVFSQVLSIPACDIAPDAHFVLDLGGDSLFYAGLCAALEEKYLLTIPLEYFGKCVTADDFARLLTHLLAEGKRNA